MHLSRVALVAALALAACGGSPSSAATSPHASAQASATTSPEASPSGNASASPSSGPSIASLLHCDVAVPAGDDLVIGSVTGDTTLVVRDIQDPANAHNLCRFDPAAANPQFVSATQVAYVTSSNQLVESQVGSGSATVLASCLCRGIDQYAVSPDGRSVTYLDQGSWHLLNSSDDRVLTVLPAAPGRDGSFDEDDTFLSFSPDGLYIALVQTWYVGGTGPKAPDQVRKASDGSLVYSTSGMTMGVWASVPSRLYFRDIGGSTVHRWDPSSGLSTMLSLHWINPKSSPDGRRISYAFRPTSSLARQIGFYSVQSNGVSNTTPPGRAWPRFLTNDLVWYEGVKGCVGIPAYQCGIGGLMGAAGTGLTYIYDIAGASEVVSRLSWVADAWPKVTAPGL